jgi:hypothetical protein
MKFFYYLKLKIVKKKSKRKIRNHKKNKINLYIYKESIIKNKYLKEKKFLDFNLKSYKIHLVFLKIIFFYLKNLFYLFDKNIF